MNSDTPIIDILKELIETWSLDKVKEYNNNNYVPPLKGKSTFIQQEFEYGLCSYNESYAVFYHNDGTVHTLKNNFTLRDWESINCLYAESLTGPLRMVKPLDNLFIEINNVYFSYSCVKNPTPSVGTPYYILDETTEFYTNYIDNISWIFKTLEKLDLPFPGQQIGPIKFVKDDLGIYFCPLSGFEHFSFNNDSREKFIEMHLFRLEHMLTSSRDAVIRKEPFSIDILNILNYAKKVWV